MPNAYLVVLKQKEYNKRKLVLPVLSIVLYRFHSVYTIPFGEKK